MRVRLNFMGMSGYREVENKSSILEFAVFNDPGMEGNSVVKKISFRLTKHEKDTGIPIYQYYSFS